MEAAAEAGKEVIVLDRPNPHDGYTDGPVLNKNGPLCRHARNSGYIWFNYWRVW